MVRGRTDVANIALARAGAGAVTSLDEDQTLEARSLRHEWPLLRDAALRSHPWDFASATASLRRLERPSEFPGDPSVPLAAWALPADCLLAREAWVDGMPEPKDRPLRVARAGAGMALHVDGAARAVRLVYTRRMDDPARWTAEFVNLVAWRMAAHLCMAVRGLSEGLQACQAMHDRALDEARRQDARGDAGRPEEQPRSLFETCRT